MDKNIKKQGVSLPNSKTKKPPANIAKALEALLNLGKVYNVGRQGIVTSFNGARVGSWKWDTNRMILGSVGGDTGSEFRKLIRKMTNEGVMIADLQPKQGEDFGTQIFYDLTDVSKLSPGQLDPILKENGYFLIDSNLPILSEGEEGANVPESST